MSSRKWVPEDERDEREREIHERFIQVQARKVWLSNQGLAINRAERRFAGRRSKEGGSGFTKSPYKGRAGRKLRARNLLKRCKLVEAAGRIRTRRREEAVRMQAKPEQGAA